MKKKVVLDFDGTLFDQTKFLPDYLVFISDYSGKSISEVEECYDESKNTANIYDWRRHLKLLDTEPKNDFFDRIGKHFNSLEGYLFTDVSEIRKTNISFTVLTIGESNFQEWKVKEALSKFHYSLITPGESKIEFLQKLNENDIFIDNRVDNFSPKFVCKQYRIIRKGDKYLNGYVTPEYVEEIFSLNIVNK